MGYVVVAKDEVVWHTHKHMFNHGGQFTNFPGRTYVNGKIDYVDMVGANDFSVHDVNAMLEELGYAKDKVIYYHFRVPEGDLDSSLKALCYNNDILSLLRYIHKHKIIDIYNEHGKTMLNTNFRSSGNNAIVIREFSESDCEYTESEENTPYSRHTYNDQQSIGMD
ncbi:hypothetical protein R6Q59_031524 [Mikania micrantha]